MTRLLLFLMLPLVGMAQTLPTDGLVPPKAEVIPADPVIPKAQIVTEEGTPAVMTPPAAPAAAAAEPAPPPPPAQPTAEQLAALARRAAESAKKEKEKKPIGTSLKTDKQARTMKLEIPGPRGQIVDRNGRTLAQNKTVYYLALNFGVLNTSAPDKVTDEEIITFGKGRVDEANRVLGKTWHVEEKDLVQHYRLRRWLPLVFSIDQTTGLNIALTKEEMDKLEPYLTKNLMLHPSYQRIYPEHDCAPHIVGYTGIRQKMPRKEIVEGEPFTEEPEGRAGLEQKFESYLRGTPGMINLLYSPDGTLLHDEVLRRPAPGHNVVLTLDYSKQKYAENALKKHAPNGGAMVILDVRNGDILAMASNPGFDLNEFIPGISSARFDQLKNDPLKPMNGRAFQGLYPPASTFKAVTGLAALESGAITPQTYYYCDTSFQIGDRAFWNWNRKTPEGDLNIVTAIKRSCNPFFYQAALAMGKQPLIDMANRLGFGEVTGIPLPEQKGVVPTDDYMLRVNKMKINGGLLAQMSIGQGDVYASPLQVAQCMAAIADGQNMPKLRLVKQIQDYNDGVVEAWEPAVRRRVDLNPIAREAVVKGMIEVVNGSGGTGHAASFDDAVEVAGKTGTGQWRIFGDDDPRNQYLAWFAGFLPARNPLYAFAVVYEGAKGEDVSGGRVAAPIVREVFKNIYKNASTEDPALLAAAKEQAPKAEIILDEGAPVPKAEPVENAAPPPPTAKPKDGLRGLFRRLFGND
jgi:penicillin-binding protein 2